MTQEEKAKAYDEALKVLHKYDGANIMFTQDLKEEMFPELAESEDERMIKSMTRLVKDFHDCNFPTPEGFERKDMLAWLEKQEDKKPYNWNDWDEKIYNILLEDYRDKAFYSHSRDKSEDINGEVLGWLELIKNRVQPVQEWTRDDEQYLLICKNALFKYQASDNWDANIIYQWLENKLKSVRPQNRWKPSEEQMKALDKLLLNGEITYVRQGPCLQSLYIDLKAL